MIVQIAGIMAVIVAAMIWWYRIKMQTQKALAEFRAESERLQGDRLRRAQEKLSLAELALSKDNNEENQQVYNEALFELNALILH